MAYGLQKSKRAIAAVGEGKEATASAANPITKSHFLCEEEFGDTRWLELSCHSYLAASTFSHSLIRKVLE